MRSVCVWFSAWVCLLGAGALSSPAIAANVGIAGPEATHSASIIPPDSRLLMYDGFEEGLTGWTTTGLASWHDGLYKLGRGSARLAKNATLTKTVDLRGFQSPTLRVSLLGVSLEGAESLVVEVLDTDGVWKAVANLTSPADDGYFRYAEVRLPDTLRDRTFSLRMRLTGNLRDDVGYVDELWVMGQPLAGPEVVAGADCPACIADFALYDPYAETDGVWEEEVFVLMHMLEAFGWTWQLVDHTDLNAGYLGTGSSRKVRALLVPGGFASYRNQAVNATGEQGIRDFVNTGGNYVGFCAGSFWATRNIQWAENATGGGGTYNQSSDYQGYVYDLGLLSGTATGPFGWSPWEGGVNPSLETVAINLQNATMASIGLPASTRFFYYGGPYFTGLNPVPSGYEVWARATMPSGTSTEASRGNGEPTIIRFASGQGDVVLFSHHPEVLVQSEVDGVTLSTYFYEEDINWDIDDSELIQSHKDSWNIVHAALQIGLNQVPTPLNSLP